METNQPMETEENIVVLKPASYYIHDNTCYTGFLHKQGGRVRNWKRRFFVLDKQERTLKYYKNLDDIEPKGSVPLTGYTVLGADEQTNKTFSFMICKQGARTYFMVSEDAVAKRNWINELTEVLREANKLPVLDTVYTNDPMDFQPKKQSIVCEKTILLEETPRQSILDPHETLVQGVFQDPNETLIEKPSGSRYVRDSSTDASLLDKAPTSITLQSDNPFFPTIKKVLTKTVKLGRKTPESDVNNANFIYYDSIMISRNHCEIWSTRDIEQNKNMVFIRDIKSSGGTYINGTRLSQSGEESAPWPLKSGDEVQLGVDRQKGTEENSKAVVLKIFLHHPTADRQSGGS